MVAYLEYKLAQGHTLWRNLVNGPKYVRSVFSIDPEQHFSRTEKTNTKLCHISYIQTHSHTPTILEPTTPRPPAPA